MTTRDTTDEPFAVDEAALRRPISTDPFKHDAGASIGERELTFIVGLVALSIGCFMVYAPLGLIVPGGILTFFGALSLIGSER